MLYIRRDVKLYSIEIPPFRWLQAMSCPPAPFLESSFLQAARDALSPGGMLVFNCVSRSKKALASALASLQRHFAEVRSEVRELDILGSSSV